MLNQSFTADNFENIYDAENRKNSIVDYLGKEYKDFLTQIKLLQKERNLIKRKKLVDWSSDEIQFITDYKQKRDDLQVKKKAIRHRELEKISFFINSKNFKFDLQQRDDNIFVIQNTRESFFAIKQLQNNVRKTFKVKQSNRHLILTQIKMLLNDSSPKYIIRTDVSSFYESISQNKLFKKINNNTLLNTQSKVFIKQIIDDYNCKKDNEIIENGKGIPRGVGISAYLSELYMKDVDNQIRNLQDIIYYARYVDDIFIVISPKLPKKNVEAYFTEISNLMSREDLSLKEIGNNKCSLVDLTQPNVSEKIITYLGYNLYIRRIGNTTRVLFGLSETKKEKIKNRISKCYARFNETNKYGIKRAKKELLLSLRFLATNTKLTGAKNRVKTGIYFSNSLLDEKYYKDIEEFDDFLKDQRLCLHEKLFQNESLQQVYCDNLMSLIVDNVNFKKGFSKQIYYNFSKDELKVIKSILR